MSFFYPKDIIEKEENRKYANRLLEVMGDANRLLNKAVRDGDGIIDFSLISNYEMRGLLAGALRVIAESDEGKAILGGRKDLYPNSNTPMEGRAIQRNAKHDPIWASVEFSRNSTPEEGYIEVEIPPDWCKLGDRIGNGGISPELPEREITRLVDTKEAWGRGLCNFPEHLLEESR